MTQPHDTLKEARQAFSQARQVTNAAQAEAGFRLDAKLASSLWSEQKHTTELRTEASRLAADAMWSASMAQLSTAAEASHDTLRATTLLGAEMYEDTSLEEDVRLHGLYRAQCASFELGHLRRESASEDAIELFRDVAECAQAATEMDAKAVDEAKVARVQANAAAALLTLAQIQRDGGGTRYREDLDRAVEFGKLSVESGALPGAMSAETMLVVAEASYEVAILIEDPKVIDKSLKAALGWTRQAADAPGAEGSLQAEARHRAANYACVFGLFRRHEDFDEGLSALRGAVELALSAARPKELPIELRGPAFETAIRTQQNLGLLLKEKGKTGESSAAFEAAGRLASEAVAVEEMPASYRAGFWYLGANAHLERAATMMVAQKTVDAAVTKVLEGARQNANQVLEMPDAPAALVARAALLACGAVGRMMQSKEASMSTVQALETIESLGQRAAHAEGADLTTRSQGAFFAADAAEKLAARAKDPRVSAEASQRAVFLHDLSRRLKQRAQR